MTALELCAELAADVARSDILGTERPKVGDWRIHEVRHAPMQYAVVIRGSRGEAAEPGAVGVSLSSRDRTDGEVFAATAYVPPCIDLEKAINAELARRNQT